MIIYLRSLVMSSNLKFLLSSLIVSAVLSGCSDSSLGPGNREDVFNNYSLAGHVIDPAIVGATVKISCGEITYNAIRKTDENGAFTISSVPERVNLNTCTFLATGGSDGDDFTGLTLKAPYKLFSQGGSILITPITTLLEKTDALSSDIQAAKQTVASYLGLNIADLLKDPTTNLALGKVSKKIVKIALKRDSSGNLIGFLDPDEAGNSLLDYVSMLDITEEQGTDLIHTLNTIDQATTVMEVIKQSIISNVYLQLKLAYKKNSYDEIQSANLRLLAEAITQANKKDSKYREVTGLHLRKALMDVDLVPSFINESQGILSGSLSSKLGLSAAEFIVFLSEKTINISQIDGFILLKVNSTEQILGDSSEKRRSYYAFSDISNIAKMLSLTSDNYSDQVNDSINADIAFALVNLGFSAEGLKHVENTVYSDSVLLSSYADLAERFIALGQNTEAAEVSIKTFNKVKQRIAIIGAENATFDEPNWLSDVIYNLNRLGKTVESDQVITYYLSFAKQAQDNTSTIKALVYSNLIKVIEDLSQKEAQNGNLVGAKKYARLAAEEVVNTSTELFSGYLDVTNFAVNQAYRSAINAEMFGEPVAAAIAANFAGTLPESFSFLGRTKSSDDYRLKIAYKALAGNPSGALNDFNNMVVIATDEDIKNTKQYALRFGLSAALYANGKENELFTIYQDPSVFSTDRDFRNLSQEVVYKMPGNLGIETPFGIQHLTGNAKLEEYLDRMFAMMETWSITSHNEARAIYASKYSEGYLALVDLYTSLNKPSKAENVLNSSFNKVNAIPNKSHKIKGFLNILNKRKDLGLNTGADVSLLLNGLNLAAQSADIQSIVKVANAHSEYNEKTLAVSLLDAAYSTLDIRIDGDLANVEERIYDLLGDGSSMTKFAGYRHLKQSIAFAYFQAGRLDKAKQSVAEALSHINTLENTSQKYRLLTVVASSYGLLGEVDLATAILPNIIISAERDRALVKVSSSLARFDAFLATNAASVDSDGDGKPDFFDFGATGADIAESGLILDDDIDNDGITDATDSLPYNNVN